MPKHAAALSPKQRRFVTEFLASGNATDAAKRAGYSEKTAYAIAHKLLRKCPAVQAAIVEAEKDKLAELRVTADRLDTVLARIAGAQSGAELELLGCSGRDQIAAVKLLYERAGLLERRHLIASTGRIGLYSADKSGAGCDWKALFNDPVVDLDDPDADKSGVALRLPKNGRDGR